MFFQKSPIISWVPPLEVYVASWGLAILILKFRLRRKQERFLESVVLSELPESISPEAAASFLQRMEVSEPKWSKSLLFHRIAKLLAHFEVTQDRSEIAALSTSQSDIDGTTLRSSYTMVKVFVWAIPILGFIGTVIGLQEAIRGFAGLSNVDRLQEQLAPITSGLGGAFQATLIALALSLLLMFPSSASERAEWRFLNKIDDFCNDQILRRLFLPLQQTQGSLVDRSELKFLANQIASELAASITLTIPKMAGVLYSELTSAERVQTLVTSLFQQILINSGKVIEGALSSQVTELKALSVSIQDDTKQRVESVELQSRILQTMTDAQSSMRETLEALQSATDGIGRVVTQVDAQQELDGVHKALERVSQLLHNGAPAAKTFNATSDGINRRG
jgi:biopolymer transport protein ExbB/TolQ